MSRTGDTSTTGAITQSNTTQSTTKDTGAIVTEGGVGIEKNLNVGGTIKNADATSSTTKDTGAIVTEGGLGVEENINAGGNITATGTMGASNLSGTNTGDVALVNVGSSPNSTGATLSGQNLNLEPADSTNPGVVTAGAQSFGGVKTFVDNVIITGDLTVNGTTTTINTATLDVEDANILINNGGNDASSEGAGLTVERTSTNATLLHEDALASKWKAGALGSESEVMTVGTAQTISGIKTFTAAPTFEEEGSTPTTPAAGYRKLYAKSDGFYQLNSSGVESELGGGGSGSGGINYLDENPSAEVDTTGWAAYADAAGSVPVNGTGGSPNSTFTRTTSSPLRGTGSFLWTKNSGASRQGEGFSYDFTIDAADKGKVLQGSFDYAIASGAFVDDAMEVFIYDVTNAALIYCSPSKLKNHSLAAEKFGFEFQTSTSSTSYRLIVHVGVTTDSSNTIKFDNFSVGPAAKLYGSPVTDWQTWTPTGGWASNCVYTGKYRRVGDSYEYDVTVDVDGAVSGNLTINLPSGHVIDTTKLGTAAGTGASKAVGSASMLVAGARYYTGSAVYQSTTAIYIINSESGNTGIVNATNPATFAAGDFVSARFVVPIVGLSSSQVMSSDANTRVVAARYNYVSSSNTTVADGAEEILDFGTKVYDTHGAVTTGASWKFTAPVSGYYRITSHFSWSSNTNLASSALQVFKNGSVDSELDKIVGADNDARMGGTSTVQLNAGEYVDIRAYQDDTASAARTVSSSAHITYVVIEQVQGPSQIMASETVACRYTHTAGTSIPNGTSPVVDFANKSFDTHNAVTTGASWKFTAPISGIYQINACLNLIYSTTSGVSTEFNIGYTVNGSGGITLGGRVHDATNNSLSYASGSDLVRLLAGDYIQLYCYQNTGADRALSTNGSINHLAIIKVGNY